MLKKSKDDLLFAQQGFKQPHLATKATDKPPIQASFAALGTRRVFKCSRSSIYPWQRWGWRGALLYWPF